MLVTSFAEPTGRRLAIWYWFALSNERDAFVFSGIWRSYTGPVGKDGATLEIDIITLMSTKPYALVATVPAG